MSSDQQKLYKAQEDAFGVEAIYGNFLTKTEAEKKTREILNSDFVGNLIETYPDLVHDADLDFEIKTNDKRFKHSQANDMGVAFAEQSRSIYVVVHEVAHALTINYDKEKSGHGEIFNFVFSKLVEEFLGQDAYLDLVSAFVANGVKFNPEGSKRKKKRFDDEIDRIWDEIDRI